MVVIMNQNKKVRIQILQFCYQRAHSADTPIPPLLDPAEVTNEDIEKVVQGVSLTEISENLSYLADMGHLTHTKLMGYKLYDVYKITSEGKRYFEEETDIWRKITHFFNQNFIASITAAVITAFVTTYITNLFL